MMEVMEVEPGVTLRENGASKPGDTKPSDPNHLTRAAFMDLMQSQTCKSLQAIIPSNILRVLDR